MSPARSRRYREGPGLWLSRCQRPRGMLETLHCRRLDLGCRFLAVRDRHCSWPSTNLKPTSPVARQGHPNVKSPHRASTTSDSASLALLRHSGIGSSAASLWPPSCRLGRLEPKIGLHANSVESRRRSTMAPDYQIRKLLHAFANYAAICLHLA